MSYTIYNYNGDALAQGETKQETVDMLNAILDGENVTVDDIEENGNGLALSPDNYLYWTNWNIRDETDDD